MAKKPAPAKGKVARGFHRMRIGVCPCCGAGIFRRARVTPIKPVTPAVGRVVKRGK